MADRTWPGRVSLRGAFLLIALSAARALAQDATYSELMRDAQREAAEGSYASARELYRKAYRAQPNAGSLLGAAMASVKLEDHPDAVRAGWAALGERHAPLDQADRARATALVEQSLRKVATYVVDAQPSTAEVAVDGETVPLGPGRELVVAPGHHTLRAIADGYVPRTIEVDAMAGSRGPLMFTLRRANAPSILLQDAEAEEEEADDGDSDFPVVPVIVLSVGVATLIAGGITGLIAVGKEGDLEDRCGDRVDMCPDRYIPIGESAEDFATATNVLWVVGGLISAVGTTWLVLALSDDDDDGDEGDPTARLRLGPPRSDRQKPRLLLAPTVAPRQAGLQLRASF